MAKRWVEVDAFFPLKLEDREACYVLQQDGITIYVGSTFYLKRRLFAHNCRRGYSPNEVWTQWGNFVGSLRVKVLYPKKYGESLMVEARLIRKLKPKFNIRGARRVFGER